MGAGERCVVSCTCVLQRNLSGDGLCEASKYDRKKYDRKKYDRKKYDRKMYGD